MSDQELIPLDKAKTPQIVDEAGKPLVGPEMEAVTGLVIQLAQLAQQARIRKALEDKIAREKFEGVIDPRVLAVTDRTRCLDLLHKWPYTPWVTAYFYNDGPDTAYISINKAFYWQELGNGEDLSIDLLRADERIGHIYYACDTGDTASVRVVGKY